ncbi:MAG: EamA family transporter [Lachnospiraceae bacterium]|nr:EamA family transporter [Lachnospiraceae bacterium]
MIYVILFLISTLTSSFASLFLKKSSNNDKGKLGILFSPFFYLGGIMYVTAATIMIYLMKVIPYAIIMPLGSVTYIWTMFISNRLLGEKITAKKIIGMCVIILGVVLLALGQASLQK